MANILILGAGVMGSALTVPASDNNNRITLVGSPLDDEIIASIRRDRKHPKLDAELPASVEPLLWTELGSKHLQLADIIVIAVSSPGINWVVSLLTEKAAPLKTLAIVTKGLTENLAGAPQTYAHSIPSTLAAHGLTLDSFVAIGGPCIAREIVFRMPTSVTYASTNQAALGSLATAMQTPFYRVHQSGDVIGVEACAALKNFFAIGVSSMLVGYEMPGTGGAVTAKNPLAATFNQAVQEMNILSIWMQGNSQTAFDLAGLGDLQVTVGGGRNSRLGKLLGEGLTCSEALEGPLIGETVEGVDTGRVLGKSIQWAFGEGQLQPDDLPLTQALIEAIDNNSSFSFDFTLLG